MIKYETVAEIASNHLFIGTEKTESIKLRARFCWCKKRLAKKHENCENLDRCPLPTEHTVVPEAINPFFAVESKDLSEKGRKLAYELKFDEFIAVETTNPSERFFICKNHSELEMRAAAWDRTRWRQVQGTFQLR
jgi:hypothetical protein